MVHSNCQNLIRTIPDLPYSETIREEIADGAEDHAVDALTYALMVIDDPESWLVSPKLREPDFAKSPYYGNSDGTISAEGIDIAKILNEKNERDWRYN